MAYTLKSRRMAYDNIAAGSATGIERIVDGTAGHGDGTTREAVDTFGVSADCVNSSFITNRVVELDLGMGGATSSGEYVGQPSSATSPFYTSATSWTSAINELNTAI